MHKAVGFTLAPTQPKCPPVPERLNKVCAGHPTPKPCRRTRVCPSCEKYLLLTSLSLSPRTVLHLAAPSQGKLTSNNWFLQAWIPGFLMQDNPDVPSQP